ncbi:hypothetical protein CHLRE_01g036050v5 [Chlamydomonas reinhardtii]|uniref:DNA mismatch repair protein S5 domain-containing protein n=1 Tax=Chlamydomonas reinhardtii TaxID=3055 RepID=A8HM54_CHLRE|nr:uncharacterized protein CHLRE_01g036050v5 [Chlamydomonas reinhardtii]PNW88590.1 hypothetical protein CHLRE_01g036050v5 [Chlamydomonas reinhardtii]|eukprot:XP_001690102.1 mismatch repair protein [Chlamydomonas reinhardtii]
MSRRQEEVAAALGPGGASEPTVAGGAAPAKPKPATPAIIRKLDENVVNKIAAGEVIQRPASALKEMLENSLDAGSTQISVTVKDGGNKLLQITDNGSGIRKEDLAILCHRHTTSKLSQFEDLETISTLGFRGEALCSISFVSHMAVTTMARDAQYGFRVTYKDSAMEAPGPKPVAAVPGTTITVEDLFYNVPTRRKALKSASEEYGLILDTLGRYAVYSAPGVGFSCRRHGDGRPDISTTAAGSRLDAVRAVYGADVARELLPLALAAGGGTGPEVPVEGPLGIKLEGLISGANYGSGKKTVLVLFINGRCVECAPLRRALEGVYAALLPKASKPWLFLDLRLPPRQVEVNMHPTKREVGFMHQAEVIEVIRGAVEAKLLASNDSRTFATGATATLQTVLPFASLPPPAHEQLLQSQLQGGSQGDGFSGSQDAAAGGGGYAADGEEEDGERDEDEAAEEAGQAQPKARRAAVAAAAPSAVGVKRPGGAGGGNGAGQAPVPYRPEKLVRVDYRAGTLDTFVVRSAPARDAGAAGATPAGDVPSTSGAAGDGDEGGAGGSDAAAAATAAARSAAAGGNVSRKRGGRPGQGGVDVLQGPLLHDSGGRGGGKGPPPGLVTADVLGIGPYAAGTQAVVEDEEPGTRDAPGAASGDLAAAAAAARALRRTPPAAVTRDAAVLSLLAEAEADCHGSLADLLREHTFVGIADGSLALLQHGTRLYLVDVGALSADLFYQLALRRWEQPLRLALEPPPLVSELVDLGLQLLEVQGEWQPEDGSPEELGALVTELLQQNRPELEREIGLVVDEQGRLASVPLLLEGLLPEPSRLADLVVALAKDVDWDSPRERALALARALANMYAARPPLPQGGGAPGPSGSGSGSQEEAAGAAAGAADAAGGVAATDLQQGARANDAGLRRDGGATDPVGKPPVGATSPGGTGTAAASETTGAAATSSLSPDSNDPRAAAYEFVVKNVVLTAMRGCLRPPRRRATDGSVVQVAALERLYRIFERC